jgi:DNA repair exonuclease SbcCD ATPase subunit
MNTEIVRTASIVAAEINAIKAQTLQTVYYASIEIGRRLLEAKTLVDHGDFGKWLEDNVDYSQSTANNLMKICLEFDDGQQDLFSKKAKSQTFGNLNYSQLVALLALPESEREEFAEENNVEDMSVRELQKAIKERDEANADKAGLELKNKVANDNIKTLINDKKEEKKKVDKLNQEVAELRKQLKEADEKNKQAEKQQVGRIIEDYNPDDDETADNDEEDSENEDAADEQHEDVRISEYKERVEALEREKTELEKKISASSSDTDFQKLLALFEMLQENFNKMYKLLESIATVQPEKAAKIKDAVKKVLGSMSDKL